MNWSLLGLKRLIPTIMDKCLGTLLHFWGVFQFTQAHPSPLPHKQCLSRPGGYVMEDWVWISKNNSIRIMWRFTNLFIYLFIYLFEMHFYIAAYKSRGYAPLCLLGFWYKVCIFVCLSCESSKNFLSKTVIFHQLLFNPFMLEL